VSTVATKECPCRERESRKGRRAGRARGRGEASRVSFFGKRKQQKEGKDKKREQTF